MPSNGELELWPTPSPPPSNTSPSRLPGATPTSTRTLLEVLKLNHERWHILFDDYGRHNHIAHHVLAVWAMGAHEDIIHTGYSKNERLQQPRGSSPGQITEDNFNDHLGDRRFYDAYVKFFTEVVRTQGFAFALEEYLFSSQANFASVSKDGKHPEMLSRFYYAGMHAMIHVGYGVEFGLPGMFVEGLALTAIGQANSEVIIPPALFASIETLRENPSQVPLPESVLQQASSRLKSVWRQVLGDASVGTASYNVHAFDVIARIVGDSKIFTPVSFGAGSPFKPTLDACGNAIYGHVNEWTVDPSSVQEKIEEVQWAVSLLYAVSGFKQLDDGGFNADFLAMHFVTSAIFLPSLVAYLPPPSQILLLRGYFA
ncbi:hypothetical protein V5O48_018150, partial [Marasmius crinis-equi]